MTAIESIFACTLCGWDRPYGAVREPDNLRPVIQCKKCGKATPHRFIAWRFVDGRQNRLRIVVGGKK